MKHSHPLAALLLVALLAGCDSAPPPSAAPSTSAVESKNLSALQSPVAAIAALDSVLPTPEPLPTADATKATFRGRIVRKGKGPATGIPVYLASVVVQADGSEPMVSYDRVTSPRTITDSEGNFVIVNAPPGKYGLVVDAVRKVFLLPNPQDGKDLLRKAAAGETADFGLLEYEDWPLDQ
jgi:hypothetical protein